MIRIRYAFLVAIATFSPIFVKAQQDLINKMMPKPVPASPNAAALGKFGNYEVSHFTGLPSISIPIFEAKSGELSVPITLSYHASGNRPTDVASWVGLGWSLSTGGQITRSVNGKRDEEHYFTHPLNAAPSSCGSFYFLQYASSGVYDTEPDVFSYSYPGGGGKFIFRNTGTYSNINSTAPIGPAYLFPYAPILVNRVNDQKFEITNESGVLYRFGTNSGGTLSTEGTNAFNGGNPTVQATTAWNLMDIVAPNSNDAITFSYQNVGTANRHDVAHTWLVTDLCDTPSGTPCPTATHISAQPSLNTDSNVNQQGVSEIFFENGKVQFFLSAGQRSDANTLKYLDRIEIYELFNGVYTRKKTVKFNYGYFTNGAGGNAALKLNTIQFIDAGGSAVVQTYTFTYFTNSFSWNPTNPNYLNARDYWRFYNGATSNTDLVKQQTVLYQATVASTPANITIGGAINRDVNTLYSKEGVLKRIDFPTGGYTEFDFENHKYLNDQSVVTNSGGLRVTKITSIESAAGIPVLKTYRYGTGESGVGRPLFSSNQLNYSAEQLVASNCDGVNPPLTYRTKTYHGSSFDVDESSPVVYPSVTEYFGDPTGTTNGKIVYEFDNGIIPADMDQTVNPSSKVFRNTFAWKRGKLTRKTVYDRLNNKLSESTTTYSTFKEQGVLVGIGAYAFRVGNGWGCATSLCANEIGEQVPQDIYHYGSYTQSSGVLMPTTLIEKNYENGNVANVVTTSTSSTYHSDKLALMQRTTSSSNANEDRVSVNIYPFQFSGIVSSFSTGAARGIYLLNTKNILTSPCESYTYLQGPGGTNQRIVASQLTTYRANSNNTNHVVPDQIFLFESAAPLLKTSFIPMTINGTNSGVTMDTRYKPRLTFVNYDTNSEITQFSKTNDIPVSFQYGYGGKLPVAEIKNAQNNTSASLVEFKYEGFEDLTGANIINDPLQAQSGKKYYNGDYTISFTKPNTRTYVIEYFYYTAPNWIFISKPYTGPTMALTEGTRIDNIRIRPIDSAMTTYTYDPLAGITSVTDPNNLTTFFGYDSFGRLQITKDYKGHATSTYNYHYYKQQ